MTEEIEDVDALKTWAYFVTNRLHDEDILNTEDHELLLELLDESFGD